MGAWIPYSGAAVAAAVPNVWTSVDISAIVGSQVAFVYLECYSAGSAPAISTRFVSMTKTDPNVTLGGKGMSSAVGGLAGTSIFVATLTDPTGSFEIIDPNGVGIVADVYVIGYCIPDRVDDQQIENNFYTGSGLQTMSVAAFPNLMATKNHGLLLCDYEINGATQRLSVFPYGATSTDWRSVTGYDGGCNNLVTYNVATPVDYNLAVEVDTQGRFQSHTSGDIFNSNIFATAIIDETYRRLNTRVLTNWTAPLYNDPWYELDLSPYVGTGGRLVLLRGTAKTAVNDRLISRPGGNTTVSRGSLAATHGTGPFTGGAVNGSSFCIMVPTDSNGVVELASKNPLSVFDIDIVGFVGPYTKGVPSMLSGSISPTGVVVTKSDRPRISFVVQDDSSGAGLLISTLECYATDQLGRRIDLVSGGVLASGIDGVISSENKAVTDKRINVSLYWPEAMISGQRYTISVDVDNYMGMSL